MQFKAQSACMCLYNIDVQKHMHYCCYHAHSNRSSSLLQVPTVQPGRLGHSVADQSGGDLHHLPSRTPSFQTHNDCY